MIPVMSTVYREVRLERGHVKMERLYLYLAFHRRMKEEWVPLRLCTYMKYQMCISEVYRRKIKWIRNRQWGVHWTTRRGDLLHRIQSGKPSGHTMLSNLYYSLSMLSLHARGIVYLVASRKWVIKSFRSFSFFNPPKAIFVPGMYFFGFSRYSKRVFSFHSIAFCLLASVYEKPSTEPVWRPKRPCKLGPILLPSPWPRVWHWAHRVLKRFAPFFASPSEKPIVVDSGIGD